jgi:hypothetical protein
MSKSRILNTDIHSEMLGGGILTKFQIYKILFNPMWYSYLIMKIQYKIHLNRNEAPFTHTHTHTLTHTHTHIYIYIYICNCLMNSFPVFNKNKLEVNH